MSIDQVLLFEVYAAVEQGGQPINVIHNGDFTRGTEGWVSASDVSLLNIGPIQ